MKQLLKTLTLTLAFAWVAPLLVAFTLTADRATLRRDVARWLECLNRTPKTPLTDLLYLLAKHPEFRNLFYHRLGQSNASARLVAALLKPIHRPCASLFIDPSSQLGAGLFIQHGFSTIVMADMGENCWVNQQVTIGYKDRGGRPKMGDNVRITAGAKVLGDITLGSHVTVGANAVVVKNVPDRCVVVGVPARIVKRAGQKVDEPLG